MNKIYNSLCRVLDVEARRKRTEKRGRERAYDSMVLEWSRYCSSFYTRTLVQSRASEALALAALHTLSVCKRFWRAKKSHSYSVGVLVYKKMRMNMNAKGLFFFVEVVLLPRITILWSVRLLSSLSYFDYEQRSVVSL